MEQPLNRDLAGGRSDRIAVRASTSIHNGTTVGWMNLQYTTK